MKVNAGPLYLEVYGVGVQIDSESPRHRAVLERLAEDFHFFVVPTQQQKPEIIFHIGTEPRSNKRFRFSLFSTRMCRVYGWGKNRFCEYGDGLSITSENSSQSREFWLTDKNFKSGGEEAYEVSYTTLHSAIGEALDQRGYHRVHALGFSRKGEGWLVILPSGGGKSTFCTKLLQEEDVKIFSDEMPLVRDQVLYPFPIRIALKAKDAQALLPNQDARFFRRRLFPAKRLFSIPKAKIAEPLRIKKIITNARNPEKQFGLNGALVSSMVIGIGLTQMTEHMLRLPTIFRLVAIGFSRLREAIRLRLNFRRKNLSREEQEWFRAITKDIQARLLAGENSSFSGAEPQIRHNLTSEKAI